MLTCDRCANWELREWGRHEWCYCLPLDKWIPQNQEACKLYRPLLWLRQLWRGSEPRPVIGYNPIPPWIVRPRKPTCRPPAKGGENG